ncbi:MAG: hypothetical protein L3J86_05215 [Thermoplasmata archaeon]|nr:hypothetical protein [Thermoplasmata archaeon]
MEFSGDLLGGLDSVLVWGSDRTAVALCAYAVAARSNRPLAWLDLRDPRGSTDEAEPFLDRLIPSEARYSTRTMSELAPVDPESNAALWTVIQPGEPDAAVSDLLNFLRLPRMIQSIATRLAEPSTPLTLFSTHTDRIVHLYPEDVEMTRRMHEATRAQSVKLVASYAGPERRDRFAFGHVLHLVPGPPQRWRPWSLVAEGHVAPSGSAGSSATPIEQVDSIRAVLDGLGLTRPPPR